jgi:type I restriction enzyme S subunit
MAGEWNERLLGDVIDIKHGFAFKGEFFRAEPPGDILLTPGNFAVGGGFKAEKLKYYDGPVPDEFVLHEGDLVVTMTDLSKDTDTLGYPAFVPSAKDGARYLHNQRLGKVILIDKSCDLGYLHYLMCSREYRHEIIASATGTTVRHTSPYRIKRFRFLLPPPGEQRAISQILGVLDRKIELNRRTNKTLEEMVRALFESWFVDFDPVRAKSEGRDTGLPSYLADLFPSRFMGPEEERLPEGWGVGAILAQAQLLGGGTPKTDCEEFWGGSISLLATERTITEKGLQESATQLIPERATVVVARGATTGRMVMLGRKMAMNQTCYAVSSSVGCPFALYCQLRAKMDELVYTAHGSVFDTITTSTFHATRFVLPPEDALRAFDLVAGPTFERILISSNESCTLTALRDALLPRLISGELSVKDAEKFVGSTL